MAALSCYLTAGGFLKGCLKVGSVGLGFGDWYIMRTEVQDKFGGNSPVEVAFLKEHPPPLPAHV